MLQDKFEGSIVAAVFLTVIDMAALFIVGSKCDGHPAPLILTVTVLGANILFSATIAINYKYIKKYDEYRR